MRIKAADRNNIQEYYFSRKLKEMAKLSETGLPVINLGIGNPDQAPSDETISKLVETSKLKNVHGYQSYVGIPELRNSFANWYSKYFKVELNPENEILPLIGSKEGIAHLFEHLLLTKTSNIPDRQKRLIEVERRGFISNSCISG